MSDMPIGCIMPEMAADFEAPRRLLRRLIQERGDSESAVSKALKRNLAYINQYLNRGKPVELGERDREVLGRRFNIPADSFRAPEIGSEIETTIYPDQPGAVRERINLLDAERYDKARKVAEDAIGPGAFADREMHVSSMTHTVYNWMAGEERRLGRPLTLEEARARTVRWFREWFHAQSS